MERTQSDNSRSRRMDKFCVQDAICECGVGVKKKKIFGKPRFNVHETQSIAAQYWAMLGILFSCSIPSKKCSDVLRDLHRNIERCGETLCAICQYDCIT